MVSLQRFPAAFPDKGRGLVIMSLLAGTEHISSVQVIGGSGSHDLLCADSPEGSSFPDVTLGHKNARCSSYCPSLYCTLMSTNPFLHASLES